MKTRIVCALGLGLALASATGRLAAQTPAWAVEVNVTEGPLMTADARSALEAHLSQVAECAPGAGPYRLAYAVSVGASGGVRSAAPDRSGGSDLAPSRVVRCVRHVLEELTLPERSDPSVLAVTFFTGGGSAGSGDAAAPATPAPATPTPAPAPGSTTSAEPSSGRSASASAGGVVVGAISAAAGRPSPTLRAGVEAGRPALTECYASALRAAPGIGGEGALHLTIEPDGRVSRAMFGGAEALASAMAICLGTAARGWTFPTASESARVDVALTFAP